VRLDLSVLPTLNALLNALVTLLLLRGRWLIRRKRVAEHRTAMIGAFSGSVIFLASYLLYHSEVGVVRFPGAGVARTLYLAILGTHTVLAAIVPFLAIVTLTLGLRGRIERHRRLARWTFPIWLYVSVTGVVVYVLLYRVRWA
jgi:uncharacterized membrane protein YozB (DUF420 family)